MKLTKNNVLTGIVIGGLFVAIGLRTNIIKLPIIHNVEARFIEGMDKDEIFVGIVHNIFVARVISKVGQTNLENLPITTEFRVEIIDNIKGNLTGEQVISQEGGYDNGILTLVEGQKLLKPGSVYILAARTDGQGHYVISSHNKGVTLIDVSSRTTTEGILDLVSKNNIWLKLEEAYRNEIPFKPDVDRGYNVNSYQSLDR